MKVDAARQAAIRNLEEKTGKSFDRWIAVAAAIKPTKHAAIVAHLKADHGLTHGYAHMIALQTLTPPAKAGATGDDAIDAQYAEGKSGLKPIYDAIIAAVRTLGDDVELSPKKAYVSLRRAKQFAIVQPSTSTRLDVGLNLPKGKKATKRLELTGSFNAMVSHRVRLEEVAEVDAEFLGWIRDAYDAAGRAR